MSLRVGIVGAGIAGRLFAIECLKNNWQVSLFDQDETHGANSCSFVAAGMLAPFTELESSEKIICELGLASLSAWPDLLQRLPQPVSLTHCGTVVVAHALDNGELTRFQRILAHRLTGNIHAVLDETILQSTTREQLEKFVPGISPSLQKGFWLPQEAHLNSIEFFRASTDYLQAHCQAWYAATFIEEITPHQIKFAKTEHSFDLVVDCRGLAAKTTWPTLHGIRGELIWLETQAVKLTCPVRILHPRYPIYIVPRGDNRFVVGATMIESDDQSPISAQSMLELLSAAYTIHPGFAEARIINTLTHCRPTFPDHLPKINYQSGLLKINGLYRHGCLIGPAVIQDAIRLVIAGKQAMRFPSLLTFSEDTSLCTSS